MTTLTSADADRILDTITSGDSARLARIALAICAAPGNPHTADSTVPLLSHWCAASSPPPAPTTETT